MLPKSDNKLKYKYIHRKVYKKTSFRNLPIRTFGKINPTKNKTILPPYIAYNHIIINNRKDGKENFNFLKYITITAK